MVVLPSKSAPAQQVLDCLRGASPLVSDPSCRPIEFIRACCPRCGLPVQAFVVAEEPFRNLPLVVDDINDHLEQSGHAGQDAAVPAAFVWCETHQDYEPPEYPATDAGLSDARASFEVHKSATA